MRKNTKQINIGCVLVGGNNPIVIQSMCDTRTEDVEATQAQIQRLYDVGCEIVRVAVPNEQAADALKSIVAFCPMPVVADIHFDWRLAVKSMENGVSKIRINPGNMPQTHLDAIIDCAKAHNTVIRLGVNSGSIDKQMLAQYASKSVALTNSLLGFVHYFESKNFDNLVLSVKSTDVNETIDTNILVSEQTNYPLHIGLTEAGLVEMGAIKNSVAIGSLLSRGIGDTIRVSLTADPVEEIRVARQILSCLGLRKDNVTFVSCPKCGRCKIDLQQYAKAVYDHVQNVRKPLKIAVMGCEVNGPGECSDADIGLAGGEKICFFKQGKIYKVVPKEGALSLFLSEVDTLLADK